MGTALCARLHLQRRLGGHRWQWGQWGRWQLRIQRPHLRRLSGQLRPAAAHRRDRTGACLGAGRRHADLQGATHRLRRPHLPVATRCRWRPFLRRYRGRHSGVVQAGRRQPGRRRCRISRHRAATSQQWPGCRSEQPDRGVIGLGCHLPGRRLSALWLAGVRDFKATRQRCHAYRGARSQRRQPRRIPPHDAHFSGHAAIAGRDEPVGIGGV